MLTDGLTDAFNDYHMGITAENVAERYQVSRAEQDALHTVAKRRLQKLLLREDLLTKLFLLD